jgi:hypothetical protein
MGNQVKRVIRVAVNLCKNTVLNFTFDSASGIAVQTNGIENIFGIVKFI